MRDVDPAEPRVVTAGFHTRVYDLVRTVPAGRVTTYGDVATVLGSPRVARHVGWALAALSSKVDAAAAATVPWWRVVNGRGRVSYRGDVWRGSEQATRLAAEGLAFTEAGGIVDFKALRWTYPTARAQGAS